MELKAPFGITDRLLSAETARGIYDRCNELLAADGFTAQGLLKRFKVGALCTTDDPADSLEHHRALARRADPATRVYPTWRPDRALAVDDPEAFNAWLSRLEAASGTAISSLRDLLDALDRRQQAFHDLGCRLSDHGVETLDSGPTSEAEAASVFATARAGRGADGEEAARYRSFLLHHLALRDHERGWVQQFHLGAMRNTNTRMRLLLGPDTGFDSIGDFEIGRPLQRFLDGLDESGRLARTIIYNLNPRDNELIATIVGSYQDGSVPGKMQLGTAWWFLDQKDGMEAQLRALSNMGLLARFVGMTTDSRSFLSFPRHDYFRRILCNLIGEDVRRGLIPDEREWLGALVSGICFTNARDYFGLPLGTAAA
jgi:glucuronate isomerase